MKKLHRTIVRLSRYPSELGEKRTRSRKGTGIGGQEKLRQGGVILGQLAGSEKEALRRRGKERGRGRERQPVPVAWYHVVVRSMYCTGQLDT